MLWKWVSTRVTSVVILLLFFSFFGAWQMWSLNCFETKKVCIIQMSLFVFPGKLFFVWFILLNSPCPCCIRVCVCVCLCLTDVLRLMRCFTSLSVVLMLISSIPIYYKSYHQHSAVHLPIETSTVWSHGLTGCSDSHHWFWCLHIHMLVK